MRPSRVFRLIFKIFIFLLSLSLTLVSVLGVMSAVMILGNPSNIGIDPSEIEMNFSISPLNMNFTLPFNLTNAGYFDITDLEVKVDIGMNYSHVDYPGPGFNQSRLINIFNKTENFGDIAKGTTGNINITGILSEFNFPPSFNFTSDVDWTVGPPAIIFYANITLSLDYSLGLHSLTLGLLNLKLFEV